MSKLIFLPVFMLLISAEFALAETRHYHTSASTAKTTNETFDIPLVRVDPETGEMKVYITPQAEQPDRLVTSASYPLKPKDNDPGLHQALTTLHQQMAIHCPQGWVKLSEWAIPTTAEITLHYAFTCMLP